MFSNRKKGITSIKETILMFEDLTSKIEVRVKPDMDAKHLVPKKDFRRI